MRIGLYALAASACLMCASANAEVIGYVAAGFNGEDTLMAISNISPYDFSDVEIEAVAGLGTGQYEDLGPLNAFLPTPVPFSDESGAFAWNYAFTNGSDATTSYRVEVAIGQTIYYSNVFSPESNLSGGTVDFLGFSGNVSPTMVAEIASGEPTGVPELSTLAMMTVGFAGLGFAAFHNRQRASLWTV